MGSREKCAAARVAAPAHLRLVQQGGRFGWGSRTALPSGLLDRGSLGHALDHLRTAACARVSLAVSPAATSVDQMWWGQDAARPALFARGEGGTCLAGWMGRARLDGSCPPPGHVRLEVEFALAPVVVHEPDLAGAAQVWESPACRTSHSRCKRAYIAIPSREWCSNHFNSLEYLEVDQIWISLSHPVPGARCHSTAAGGGMPCQRWGALPSPCRVPP